MSEMKQGSKGLPGERNPRRLAFHDDDRGMALLREMARQDGCSAVALMRRLIRKEAADRGIELPAVVRDPERCAGDPILAGTRTAVHDVVASARIYGGDLDAVQAELPHLSMEQIQAALAWYGEHTAEIDEILRQVHEDYAHGLAAAPARR
jgi:uncharacterized protein (DUF433 family)